MYLQVARRCVMFRVAALLWNRIKRKNDFLIQNRHPFCLILLHQRRIHFQKHQYRIFLKWSDDRSGTISCNTTCNTDESSMMSRTTILGIICVLISTLMPNLQQKLYCRSHHGNWQNFAKRVAAEIDQLSISWNMKSSCVQSDTLETFQKCPFALIHFSPVTHQVSPPSTNSLSLSKPSNIATPSFSLFLFIAFIQSISLQPPSAIAK